MKWITFAAEDAPRVLTSTSHECQGDRCAECPGIFHVAEAGDEPVFCTHWCHQKAEVV